MKFLDVTLRNYGSFRGETVFPLDDRGLCLILGRNHDDPRMESNASGKSQLPDSIDWCFFGVVPRGDTADSVINEKEGKGCQVVTRLENDDGVPVYVQRSRKVKGEKNGLRFWVGDDELTTLDTVETQKRLERELGLDREVFHATSLFAQFDSFRFADATDAERKALLTKIVPELGVIDGWLERVKELASEAGAELANAASAASTTSLALHTLRENSPEDLAREWERVRADEAAATAHAEAQAAAHLAAEDVRAYEELHELGEEYAPVAPPPVLPSEYELQLANDKVTAATEVGRTTRQLAAAKQHAHALATGATCSECGQALPSQPTQEQISDADARVLAAIYEHTGATGHANNIHDQLQQAAYATTMRRSEFDVQTRAHAVELEAFATRNARRLELQKRRTDIASELEKHRDPIATAPAVNPYVERLDAWHANVQTAEYEYGTASQKAIAAQSRIDLLEFWRDAFGPRGIKSHILDSRLKEMSDEANRWVGLLSGNTTWVRFETQTKVGKGKNEKLVDAFNIRVFRHNPDGTQTERNYRSWSGGEQHRIGTGVDFGLARLVANRASRRYDVLFLDEIFGKHLDSAGKEAVAEMLQHLSAEKSSIFVIDHDPRFQAQFNEVVVVEKRNGESSIMENQ